MGVTNDIQTHTRQLILNAVGDRLSSEDAMYPSHSIPIVEKSNALPELPYILYDRMDRDFERTRSSFITNATMYIRVYTDASDGGELLNELIDDILVALVSERVPGNLMFSGYNVIDVTPAPSTTVDIMGERIELEVIVHYESNRR